MPMTRSFKELVERLAEPIRILQRRWGGKGPATRAGREAG